MIFSITAVQSYEQPTNILHPALAQRDPAPHKNNAWRLNRAWITVAGLIAMLVSALAFAPVQASSLTKAAQRTIPSGNFHMEPGQEINEDVVVFSGNVTLDEESRIDGDLLVMSGNINIAEDAVIEGDVAALSGNITLYGTVEGDIAALSGNVKLLDGSSVGGDISVASGNVDRHQNADVGGEIVSGSGFNLNFGDMFGFTNTVDDAVRVEIEAELAEVDREQSERRADGDNQSRRGGGIGAVIGGIFGAIFTALVMGIIAGIVALVRPSIIQSVQKRFKDELALCFGTGLVVNLGVSFLAGIMAITIVGLIVAIPALIALFFLNILGGVTAAAALGERIIKRTNFSASSPIKIGLGAAAIILPIALFWSMGSCFSFLGFIGFFLLTSIGTGALVLPWVRRFMSDSTSDQYSDNVRADDDEWMNETKPADDVNDDDVEDDIEEWDEEFEEAAQSDEMDDSDVASNQDQSTDDVEDDAAGEVTQAEAAPKARKKTSAADDFTRIRGIGAVFAARLLDADVISYAQLAAMTAEEIGEIFGWPADRVERDDIIGQAQALADE